MPERRAASSPKRRRVALLMDAIEDDYEAAIVRGAAAAAQAEGVDLWCLAGGVVGSTLEDARSARNFLFELLRPADFDGILVLSGSLGNQLGVRAFEQWLARYQGVPMVSIGVELGICQNVVADGASGTREALVHLIERHNHRRIAFVRGPTTSFEAQERFAVYREVLSQFGITEDPRLILQGNWLRDSGALAVRELFDERGIAIDAVSAIACANDHMALGVMDALRERGVSVPSNLAVTGFDDGEVGKCAVPPLTTVRQPTDLMGREGVRRLLALMNGAPEQPLTRLPAKLVERRSCGCARASGLATRRGMGKASRSLEMSVLDKRAVIFAELSRSARGSFVGAGVRWEERLVTALLSDLRIQDGQAFLSALDQLLVGVQRAGGDLSQVQAMLGTLRRLLLDCAPGEIESVMRIDDLVDAARELVGECLTRGETLRRMDVIEFLRALSRANSLLLCHSASAHPRAAFEPVLRRLDFGALSLGLFERAGRASERCRCLAAFEPTGKLHTEDHFASSGFAAPGVFEQERGPVLVQALVHDAEPIGLLAVPLGDYHSSLYEQMRDTFAIGLRGFRLANGGG